MAANPVCLNNVVALISRDIMVRFGRENLGFIWTIVEPMILCAGVMTIWSFIHQSTIHNIPVVGFVMTAYMPLTLWRHLINPMVRLVGNNAELLYHERLSHLDIVLSRQILEFISTTAALGVIYLILLSLGQIEPVQDWGILLAAWLFTGWYHAGIGLIVAALTQVFEPADRFIQPAQYLALPLSGSFFMVDWLPTALQNLISWNPAVHCFEMFRAGFFGESVVTHYDPAYMAVWSVLLSALGIYALRNVRDYLPI